LLAIISLAISSVVICSMGKARYVWVTGFPWAVLTVLIFWADFLNIFTIYLPKGEWLMFIVSIVMAVLVVIVCLGALKRCLYLSKTVPPNHATSQTVEAEELKHLQDLVATDAAAKRFKELTLDTH
jgi:carbon starvation protein